MLFKVISRPSTLNNVKQVRYRYNYNIPIEKKEASLQQ